MGCRPSKHAPGSEKSFGQSKPPAGDDLAAPATTSLPEPRPEAPSDGQSSSAASQYGSSAHTSQAPGLGLNSADAANTDSSPQEAADGTGVAAAAATAGSAAAAPCGAAEAADEQQGTPKASSEYHNFQRPVRSSLRTSFDHRSSSADGSKAKSVGFSQEDIQRVERISSGSSDISNHTASTNLASANSISLKKIVDMFYDRVLAHPDLKSFFDGIDMAKLKRHQVKFMSLAFGGKELVFEEDPNLNLRKVHYRLIRDKGLNETHWELFVGIFEDVLHDLPSLPAKAVAQALASIKGTRGFFVGIDQEDQVPKSIMDMPVEPVDEAHLPDN